ncbi:MAG TPA: uroporphyrinogen decarboxylase family protein [Candidatus Brocadiia bacterium]|nr:uroporphyrinogen decarboxylase family protein [Candidatus Brocadiia bacterium]
MADNATFTTATMTRKERYLAALRGRQTDELVWAPNFDWWYSINRQQGTIPEAYAGLEPNDLIRAVDATIWRRVGIMKSSRDGVTSESRTEDGRRVTITKTPVGEVRTVHIQASDFSGAWFLKEHAVKTVDDLRVMRYIVESEHDEPHFEPALKALKEVGDDGIVLTCLHAVPYIQFAKVDVGYEDAFYLMQDYPKEVDEFLEVCMAKFLEAYRIAAKCPLELISNGDNMDCWTTPPDYFKKYAIPYYHAVREILHPAGKIAQGHWCGRVEGILSLVPDCGLDVIEAVTPRPMTRLDMVDALDVCSGKVVIQGGLPSILMCEQGGTRDDLARFLNDLLDKIGHRPGFILGMGDNVPADADFHRVRMVSDIVNDYNRNRRLKR